MCTERCTFLFSERNLDQSLCHCISNPHTYEVGDIREKTGERVGGDRVEGKGVGWWVGVGGGAEGEGGGVRRHP